MMEITVFLIIFIQSIMQAALSEKIMFIKRLIFLVLIIFSINPKIYLMSPFEQLSGTRELCQAHLPGSGALSNIAICQSRTIQRSHCPQVSAQITHRDQT